MAKAIKDRLGYIHTSESIKKTQETLANVKDGDVVCFDRNTKDSGTGWMSIIIDRKIWQKSKLRANEENKTLDEYAAEGYDLEIVGHWQDGLKRHTFWNNIVNYDYDLLDLMELNKTIIKNNT